jgi:enoyl-CoA hydratase/carnithine racemase
MLFMTGDPIAAQEALRLNLVVEVVSPERLMERSVALAQRMASMSPAALAALKRLVEMGTSRDFSLALPYERMMVTYLYDAQESRDRVKDFVGKKRAR